MRKKLITAIAALIPCCIYGQTVIYEYDESGNIISRHLQTPVSMARENVNNYDDIITDLSVFTSPNPTDGLTTIHVVGMHGSKVEYVVYGPMSRPVASGTFSGESHEIDLSSNPEGLYVIEVKDSTRSVTNKIIKK